MKPTRGLIVLFMVVATAAFAQKKDVLLTIDGEPVYASDFKKVYKKNLDLVQEASQKTVDGYLDLFIDYKLKVKEAYDQGFHEDKTYKKEFGNYQEQLSRAYLYEDKVTDDLVKEAYERGKFDVRASHILIQTTYTDTPADTLEAYNKIKALRDRALQGESFNTLAKNNSEDPSAKDNAGDLGYFTAFSMVYPFETAAYTTEVGAISNIIRSSFGYHILKVVDKKEKAPQREVSHIMIFDKSNDTRTFNPEERINEVYQLLQQGQEFSDLAKQYSDDKGSATQGGKLRPFYKNEIRSEIFADTVFSIKAEGTITTPFKSELGWHIVRLEEIKKLPALEDVKDELVQKVKSGNRSKVVKAAVANQIKDKYGFEIQNAYLPFFEAYVNDSLLQGWWSKTPLVADKDKVIFEIGDQEVRYSDFAHYVFENQSRNLRVSTTREALVTLYDTFETEMVKQYFRERLEMENETYAAVINEYRDGLLIFNIMNDRVWNEAKKDTIALEEYYEQTKEAYTWQERFAGSIFNTTDKDVASTVREKLLVGETAKTLKESMNDKEQVKVIVSTGKFEKNAPQLPANFEMKQGVSSVFENGNTFTVIQVNELIAPSVKEFKEVRGKVMSEFQAKIEQDWIQSLRDKYDVKVNKKTLKKIKKELDA